MEGPGFQRAQIGVTGWVAWDVCVCECVRVCPSLKHTQNNLGPWESCLGWGRLAGRLGEDVQDAGTGARLSWSGCVCGNERMALRPAGREPSAVGMQQLRPCSRAGNASHGSLLPQCGLSSGSLQPRSAWPHLFVSARCVHSPGSGRRP